MKTYTYPTDINTKELRRKADARRSALVAAGCATYEIVWRDGLQRIICLCCGLGTFNTHDIKEKFCGFCGHWHAEWEGLGHEQIDLRRAARIDQTCEPAAG